MAKLVDAYASGAYGETLGSSSLPLGTYGKGKNKSLGVFRYLENCSNWEHSHGTSGIRVDWC